MTNVDDICNVSIIAALQHWFDSIIAGGGISVSFPKSGS